MLKTSFKPVIVLIIIIFIISLLPISIADQYGTIQGRALDKNGNGIAGVSLKLQNVDYKTVATSVTGADGSYSFNQVPSPSGADLYRVIATLDKDGRHWDSSTAFFEVMLLRITSKDIHFEDYPASGIGCLYGVVTSDQNMIIPVPATIYLDNGMFMPYAGGRYDTWSFEQLPQGKYVVWAETNIGNETYTSQRTNVTVVTDERGYFAIFLPTYIAGTNKVAYHSQPAQMKNIVHGIVVQSNGIRYRDAKVDLYRVSGSSHILVATSTTNTTGQYLFDGVNVDSPSEKFMVRVTVEVNGALHTQDSGQFTVYYANTLGVQHDINVPVSLGFVNSGSVLLQSTPSGAKIMIDGVDTHFSTPYNVTGLPVGSHTITLSMDDYFDDSFTVQLQQDAALMLNRTLKTSTGSSYIDVKPAGASVYVDGIYAGVSPVNLMKYPAGPHTYTIACDGYRNESGTIEIVAGGTNFKEIDMVATPGLSLTYIGYLISSLIHQIYSMF
jgi:hypothetical protein